MSPRVIAFSAILTVLLAGGAVILMSGEGGGSIGATGTVDSGGRSLSEGGADGTRGPDGVVGTSDPRSGATGRTTSGAGTGRERGPDGNRDPLTGDGVDGTGTGAGPGNVAPLNPRDAGTRDGGERTTARDGGDRTNGRDGSGGRDRTGSSGSSIPESGAPATLRGTVVVTSPEGERFPDLAGTLRVRLTHAGGEEVRDLSVTSGSFTIETPEGATLRFETATLGDQEASISPPEVRNVRAGTALQLIASWTSRTTLHVRSRETGEDLCELEMLRINDWMRNSRPHPGLAIPSDARWTVECSPFRLDRDGPGAGATSPYHVRAPGYAWGRILLDTASGGDRELQLDPGGDLDLTLIGGWDRPGALLRLRVVGENQPYAEVAVQGESMQIHGIHPGDYEVSVETGSWAQSPLVLGLAEITIDPAAPLAIDLIIDEIEDEDRVPLAGTVFVPDGWSLDDFTVRVRPVDPGRNVAVETQHVPSLEMSADPVSGGTLYGWQADPVQPGMFGVLVLPIGYGINVMVGPEGNEQANLELPPAVAVEVQTMLAGSALPADPTYIRWTPSRLPGVPGAAADSVPAEPGGGVFLFDAPLGEIILSCSDARYRPTSRQVSLTAEGPNVFTLELEPAHGITILLFDGETPVPWDLGWHAHLTAMDGSSGQVVTRGRIGIGYRILVSEPGNYLLTVPEIAGFLPVSDQPVVVVENDIFDVEVGLEREP